MVGLSGNRYFARQLMKRAKIIWPAILLSLLASLAGAQTNQPALCLGDVPPPIQVASWIKGTPVTSLETGKVYVVEFWATWCVPCKKSIPHLTKLAKKYNGEVTFLGVSIWERPKEKTVAGINQLVVPFVKSMGDKMDYNVAIDGVAGFMAKHWQEAAQQPGIPTAFVINKEGRIAWIGLPNELGPVLGKVIAGTWDIAAEKNRAAAAREKQAVEERAIEAVFKAQAAQDYPAWVAAVDQAEKTAPSLANHPDFPSIKLQPLLRTDPVRAVAYIKTL